MGAVRDSSRFLLVVSFFAGLYVVAVGLEPDLWLPMAVLVVGMATVVLAAYRFHDDYAAEE